MELRRLRLVNFRQHQDTEIEFGHGVTGIVGPNGAGKTTVLEAIGWALYGTQAARGDKDSVRNLRAKPRASVQVELEFSLGGHEYRVKRGLYSAELYRDGAVVANALKEVTEHLTRTLGMTHDEFFNTYFTAQKDLAVMAKLGPEARGAFLSRVLGYERLDRARAAVREARATMAAELRGLEAGLPDPAALAAERDRAEARLADTGRAVREAERARGAAAERLGQEEPRWKEWQARRDRTLSLDSDRRIAEKEVEQARQEFARLDRELVNAREAQRQLTALEPELGPVEALEREEQTLAGLQGAAAARRADEAQLAELARAAGAAAARLAELERALETLPAGEREAAALAERLAEAERAEDEARTAWVRERQYAETKRNELREQFKEVRGERDRLVELGPEGTCPTCRRPLGDEYPQVLAVLDAQLEGIRNNGEFFARRFEQLADAPAAVRELAAAREAAAREARAASDRVAALRAQADERRRLAAEREDLARRAAELEAGLAARPAGYDARRHEAVRAELARRRPVVLEAAALRDRARAAEVLVREAELAEKALSVKEERARQLAAAVAAEGFSEREYAAARARHEAATAALRGAEVRLAEARGELSGAEIAVADAQARAAARTGQERQIVALKSRIKLHEALDAAYSALRAELNAAMRPEIAELASAFLADLTDGRYREVDITEHYDLTVLDEGVPKPVISGGEEDVANLVFRLAISQMIAERAGQPLSLLVLDEVFGSLDESRREHVLSLLRRLADRFPQVILITHIEQIREGLDRVIRIDYDAGRGTSVVSDETATLRGTDAGVAA